MEERERHRERERKRMKVVRKSAMWDNANQSNIKNHKGNTKETTF